MRISEHSSLSLRWSASAMAVAILLVVMLSETEHAFAIDPPHNGKNSLNMTISCTSCHFDTSGPTPSWATQPTTTDETFFNNLCTSCHMPSQMTDSRYVVKTHSSSNTSGKYGTWTVECRRCHNPHVQDQVSSYPTDSTADLATGSVVSYAQAPVASLQSTIIVSAGLTPNAWTDHILVPNVSYPTKMYHIRSNANNSITVSGAIDGRYAKSGNTFAIRYGKMVRSEIGLPSSGVKAVKFFGASGMNSFGTSTDPVNMTSICQVCHVQTASFNNSGMLEGPGHPSLQAGGDCTQCHTHASGFKAECGSCHGNPPLLNVLGGPDGLALNDGGTGPTAPGAHGTHAVSLQYACTTCHSDGMPASTIYDKLIQIGFTIANGVYQTGSYDGRVSLANGFTYTKGNAGTTITKAGTKVCSNVYCHGSTMAPNGGTDITPVWDDPSTAACGTCHGATATTPPVRGSHSKHARAHLNGYMYACSLCHTDPSVDDSLHVNNRSEVLFSLNPMTSGGTYSGTPGMLDAYGSCTNVYCHSTVQSSPPGGAPTYRTSPAWGNNNSMGCGGCHNYATGLATGSHGKHMQQPELQECWACHNYTGSDDGCMACHDADSIQPKRDKHANYSIDVAFAPMYGGAYSGTPAPGDAYGNCSSVYCHSNGSSFYTGMVPVNSSPQWGSGVLGCNGCHGNTVYDNYREAAPLNASGSPKPNAHSYHIDASDGSPYGSTGSGTQCKHCHILTTSTNSTISNPDIHVNRTVEVAAGGNYPDGDVIGAASVPVTLSYSLKGAADGSTCSVVSCHPTGVGGAAHSTATKWSDTYSCTDCHAISLSGTTGYHHAMDAAAMADRSYPVSAPSASANDRNRKCTICHVDHNVFSPRVNAQNSAGRAMNLRTSIGTLPDPSSMSTYTNSDYGAGGGICISCHQNGLAKNTTARKNDATATTMTITSAGYASSAHQYAVPSVVTSGSSTFNANCSKCHSTTDPVRFQSSVFAFRTHDTPLRRLLSSLGIVSPTDPVEEQFCFRCHSRSDDNAPGGGPAKSAAGKDYYGAVFMTPASEAVYALGRFSLTDALYFRDTVPASPAPAASGSTDPFQGGTWQARNMLPQPGIAAQSQTVTISDTGNPRYWRMTGFVSPPVNGTVTIPGGSWTVSIAGRQSIATANCYLRGTIYVWTAGNSMGQVIAPPAGMPDDQYVWIEPGCDEEGCWDGYWQLAVSNQFQTYDVQRNLVLNGSEVTLNAGDRIVVEVEVDSRAPSAPGATVTYVWNHQWYAGTSRIVLPAPVPFDWLPAIMSAHRPEQYSAIHRPSPADETRSALSANKHVECSDCHDPHSAAAGTHTQGTNTIANALRGADGVQVPSWPASWTTPSFADGRTTAAYEWQVCFKCHSSYNTDLAGWSAAWTDLAREFNPNNPSYHAVIGGSKLPAQGSFVNGWSHDSTITCSDCHTSDQAGAGDPKGPHASSVPGIVKADGRSGQLCFNCHSSTFANSGFSGPDGELHNCHYTFCGTPSDMNCYTCHSRIPHGAPRPRLIVLNGDDPRYLDPSTGHENSWTQNSFNYTGVECSGYCH